MATQPPNLPTQSYLQNQARNQLQNELERLYSYTRQVTPNYKQIPTFGANYYIPQQSLSRINQIASARPNINTSQLQQMAEQRTSLFTNPQIEALQQQLAAFKSLIPREQRTINEGYAAARNQMGQGVENVIAALVQEAERSGGLRSGVYDALSRKVQDESMPLFDALEASRTSDIGKIIGSLEVEKQNAQTALRDLQANRKNMTKMQYNALYDEAVNRFRSAQQQQLALMQQVMAMEADARKSSAALQQEQASEYNTYQNALAAMDQQYLQNLANLGFGQLDILQDQLSRQLEAQTQQGIQQWQNFLMSQARSGNNVMDLLNRYRGQIERTIGVNGFTQLQRWLENQPIALITPSSTTSGVASQSTSSPQNGNVFARTLFGLSPALQMGGRALGIQPYNPISALINWAFGQTRPEDWYTRSEASTNR